MKKYCSIFAVIVVCIGLLSIGMHDAEAKRFGGGSSFGSRPSHSSAFSGSSAPASVSRSASQQQNAAQNQMARQNVSQRGGLMGMLGGLAIGGLLGSLLFGGAFENINFMDIAMLVMAFLMFRYLASKIKTAQPQAYQRTSDNNQSKNMEINSAGFNTDYLFNKQGASTVNQNNLPVGFDTNGFLKGATIAYTTLQKAWDARDLYEIRGLTTDKVFAEIQTQLKASDTDNQTEILNVDTKLLEVRDIGSELSAVVLFEAVMREEINGATEHIREVWHFVKPKASSQTKWLLDGIQQWAD